MTVYIIHRDVDWEFGEVIGVFSNIDSARKAVLQWIEEQIEDYKKVEIEISWAEIDRNYWEQKPRGDDSIHIEAWGIGE